jgi:hypothetical protein
MTPFRASLSCVGMATFGFGRVTPQPPSFQGVCASLCQGEVEQGLVHTNGSGIAALVKEPRLCKVRLATSRRSGRPHAVNDDSHHKPQQPTTTRPRHTRKPHTQRRHNTHQTKPTAFRTPPTGGAPGDTTGRSQSCLPKKKKKIRVDKRIALLENGFA